MGLPQVLPPYQTTCPHLGLPNDAETRFGFPSPGNHCHRFSPAASITREYQQTWCLSGKFPECQVYQEANAKDLPDGLRLPAKGLQSQRVRSLIAIVLVLAVMLVCVGFLISGRQRSQNQERQAVAGTMTQAAGLDALTQTASALIASTPSATPIPKNTTTPTPTASATLEPTSTPTPPPPTAGPSLETAFGTRPKFLIHQVKVGESIQNIARAYNTSGTLILAINQFPPGISLRPDTMIVIIPEEQDYPGLPVFQPVFLEVDTTVTELATQYDVSSDDLRRFNGFGEGELVPANRWIVVPLPATTSP